MNNKVRIIKQADRAQAERERARPVPPLIDPGPVMARETAATVAHWVGEFRGRRRPGLAEIRRLLGGPDLRPVESR